MPTAICRDCGNYQPWSNKGGRSIMEFNCLKCGGQLRRMTKKEVHEKWGELWKKYPSKPLGRER